MITAHETPNRGTAAGRSAKGRILLAVTILAIAGCATTPTPTERAEPAVTTLEAGAMRQGRGVIAVTRDTGMMGIACRYYLFVDSVAVGFVTAGQRLEVGADPGERVVTADVRGICGGGTANYAVHVQPDAVHYLRIGATQSGDLRFEPAAPGYR